VNHLHDLLVVRQEEVLVRARAKATARFGLLATKRTFRPGQELFAGQLMAALAAPAFRPELLHQVAARLGGSWLRNGLDVSELVLSYSDICEATLEMALECATPVDATELLILSYCLNEARASAVAGYEEQRRQDVSRRDERQLNQLGGELAKLLDAALFALGGLRSGSPELQGPAEELLDCSLRHLRERIDQALYGVRTQPATVLTEAQEGTTRPAQPQAPTDCS
jgi:hypothetical protein